MQTTRTLLHLFRTFTCIYYMQSFGAHFVHMHVIKRHTSYTGLYSCVPITSRLLGTFIAYEVLRCSYLRLHNLGNHNELIHS